MDGGCERGGDLRRDRSIERCGSCAAGGVEGSGGAAGRVEGSSTTPRGSAAGGGAAGRRAASGGIGPGGVAGGGAGADGANYAGAIAEVRRSLQARQGLLQRGQAQGRVRVL